MKPALKCECGGVVWKENVLHAQNLVVLHVTMYSCVECGHVVWRDHQLGNLSWEQVKEQAAMEVERRK